MKNIKYILIIFGLSILATSCSKGSDDIDEPTPSPTPTPVVPVEPVYPTFDAPNWSISNQEAYESSMTGIVTLPDSLLSSENAYDQLAVFTGTECRGVAERIEINTSKYVWMVMIRGNVSENSALSLQIRYWSYSTKHMYMSAKDISFVADSKFGSIDSPYSLGMNIRTDK